MKLAGIADWMKFKPRYSESSYVISKNGTARDEHKQHDMIRCLEICRVWSPHEYAIGEITYFINTPFVSGSETKYRSGSVNGVLPAPFTTRFHCTFNRPTLSWGIKPETYRKASGPQRRCFRCLFIRNSKPSTSP